MRLAELTWQDVRDLDREMVVVIPTGSLEQHGPHLPLFTDSILATFAAEAVERMRPDRLLLTPTLWLGASGHHLAFAGSLSATFSAYMGSIASIVDSLWPHGFRKFYIVNGHGGNTEPNGMVLRELKAKYLNGVFGHAGYFSFGEKEAAEAMTGPWKFIRHACEAEASLMLHVRPDLVRMKKLRDDGLEPSPPVKGVVLHFDERTEEGSLGFATYATAEKGKAIMDACVAGLAAELDAIYSGFVMLGPEVAE